MKLKFATFLSLLVFCGVLGGFTTAVNSQDDYDQRPAASSGGVAVVENQNGDAAAAITSRRRFLAPEDCVYQVVITVTATLAIAFSSSDTSTLEMKAGESIGNVTLTAVAGSSAVVYINQTLVEECGHEVTLQAEVNGGPSPTASHACGLTRIDWFVSVLLSDMSCLFTSEQPSSTPSSIPSTSSAPTSDWVIGSSEMVTLSGDNPSSRDSLSEEGSDGGEGGTVSSSSSYVATQNNNIGLGKILQAMFVMYLWC